MYLLQRISVLQGCIFLQCIKGHIPRRTQYTLASWCTKVGNGHHNNWTQCTITRIFPQDTRVISLG